MDERLKYKFFLIQTLGATLACYFISIVCDVFRVLYVNAFTESNYSFFVIFQGYINDDASSVQKWEAYIFSPILETLFFQVFLVFILEKKINRQWLIAIFISFVFGYAHTYRFSTIAAICIGISVLPITLAYIHGTKRIGRKLSAFSAMIAHSLLNFLFSAY
ncbi:CPBP family glutamic-type intramembrane protease [Pseudoteredinibacter isoporae]|uniref:CAAX prenyl protease 2/Lysostaphin resistance protein A-like domain-containing protein n=1 Tax=Pseudoteredinibacter isoporae TaxID=570281 RepID=A0A7X0JQB7_9GAMM|nr:CPBP family glutamic-type intramembrane protease [Pseudoteredinibacter isoporae]MBB6520344.1 hypothetical protein [Pseudoteredinibacter isoporae]NHO85914.1 CPBP family intramembrane metalloprotease [Pseudoteredinibacter isoporae]NIB25634.1 CPBP family intramembrane metalloprotease [Pseudoteredinibacter isoporae]